VLYDPQRALTLLRVGASSPSAEFREDQEASIRHVVEGPVWPLALARTGAGE
jgi:hypothetical protein